MIILTKAVALTLASVVLTNWSNPSAQTQNYNGTVDARQRQKAVLARLPSVQFCVVITTDWTHDARIDSSHDAFERDSEFLKTELIRSGVKFNKDNSSTPALIISREIEVRSFCLRELKVKVYMEEEVKIARNSVRKELTTYFVEHTKQVNDLAILGRELDLLTRSAITAFCIDWMEMNPKK